MANYDDNLTVDTTILTIPAYGDVAGLSLPATDYAADNGIGGHYTTTIYDAQGNPHQHVCAACWINGANSGYLGADIYRGTQHGADWMYCYPENRMIGAAFSLAQNATGKLQARTTATGERFLTNEGRPVFYPQTRVNPQLKATLTAMRQKGGFENLVLAGAYHRPEHCNAHEPTMKTEIDMCYAYQGNCYVNVRDEQRDDWYLVEPVHLIANEVTEQLVTSNLLMNAPLANARYFAEMVKNGTFDVQRTALGHYFNHVLANDLLLSANLAQYMKLTHTSVAFATSDLKKEHVANCDRQNTL